MTMTYMYTCGLLPFTKEHLCNVKSSHLVINTFIFSKQYHLTATNEVHTERQVMKDQSDAHEAIFENEYTSISHNVRTSLLTRMSLIVMTNLQQHACERQTAYKTGNHSHILSHNIPPTPHRLHTYHHYKEHHVLHLSFMMNLYCRQSSHKLWPSLYTIPVTVDLSIMYGLWMDIYDITVLSDKSPSPQLYFLSIYNASFLKNYCQTICLVTKYHETRSIWCSSN
jgi:hypothetical protein